MNRNIKESLSPSLRTPEIIAAIERELAGVGQFPNVVFGQLAVSALKKLNIDARAVCRVARRNGGPGGVRIVPIFSGPKTEAQHLIAGGETKPTN